jgi:hypothetical protein
MFTVALVFFSGVGLAQAAAEPKPPTNLAKLEHDLTFLRGQYAQRLADQRMTSESEGDLTPQQRALQDAQHAAAQKGGEQYKAILCNDEYGAYNFDLCSTSD